jgi:hypothetical protein
MLFHNGLERSTDKAGRATFAKSGGEMAYFRQSASVNGDRRLGRLAAGRLPGLAGRPAVARAVPVRLLERTIPCAGTNRSPLLCNENRLTSCMRSRSAATRHDHSNARECDGSLFPAFERLNHSRLLRRIASRIIV